MVGTARLAAVALALVVALVVAVPPAEAPVTWRPLPRSAEELVREDLQLLAAVIHAEARGEPWEGKVAVGAVVLNRVRDSRYPDTVAAVIESPGQFAVSRGGDRPGPECYEAARAALAGEDPTGGALYFWSVDDGWIGQRPVVCKIGGHTFAR